MSNDLLTNNQEVSSSGPLIKKPTRATGKAQVAMRALSAQPKAAAVSLAPSVDEIEKLRVDTIRNSRDQYIVDKTQAI